MKSAKLAILAVLAASLTAGGLPAQVPFEGPDVTGGPNSATAWVPAQEAMVPSPAPTVPSDSPAPVTADTAPATAEVPESDAADPHPDSNGESAAPEDGDAGYSPVIGGGFPVPGPDTPMVTDPDGTVRSAVETDISAMHDHGAQTFSTRNGGASTAGAAARSATLRVTLVFATLTDNRNAFDKTAREAAANSIAESNKYWRAASNNRLGMEIVETKSINSTANSGQDYAEMMNTIRRDLQWYEDPDEALVVFVPAGDLRSDGYGGILGGGWTSGPTSGSVLMPRPSGFTNNVVTHELGHVLGLLHANSLKCNNGRSDIGINSAGRWADGSCTSREYGDTSDLMGYAQYNSPLINSYFWDSGSFGRGDEIHNAGSPGRSSTYTLKAWAGSASNRAVKFTDPSGETYYLELRLPVGYDAGTAVGGNRGVKIVKADLANSWAVNSLIISPNTRDFAGYTNANSTWQAGQTFTTHAGTSVKINWISSDSASVTVTGYVREDRTQRVFSPGDFDGDGTADVLIRRADGTLWLSRGRGNGAFYPSIWIGTGFEIFDRFVAVGDYDGDGRNDFLARGVDGSLWFYSGTGAVHTGEEGYRSRGKIGEYGWDAFDSLIGVGDADGNGRNDILARSPNGTVYLYSGTGTGQHGPSRAVATGWNQYNGLVGVRDFTGDGKVDVLVRTFDGRISIQQGTGTGTFNQGPIIGSGWNGYWDILGGDFNGDGRIDLLGYRSTDAGLTFYPGTGTVSEGYAAPVPTQGLSLAEAARVIDAGDFNGDKVADVLSIDRQDRLWLHPGVAAGSGKYAAATWIGTGWGIFTDVIASDYNGDGRSDLIALRKDGTLWFYAGTGVVGPGNEGYRAAEKIGSGWDIFDDLLAPGDVNLDGLPDILARHKNGSLWFYAGLGNTGGGREGYRPGTVVGNNGWQEFAELTAAGDYDRKGTNDILARFPDGRLFLYRGVGNGGFAPGEQVGSGWNSFSSVVGPGDTRARDRYGYLSLYPGGSSLFYRSDGMPSEGYGSAVAVGSF